MRKRLLLVPATAVSLLLLAGCSASGTPSPTATSTAAADPCASVSSGPVSKSVKVSGEFPAKPAVTIPEKFSAKKMQRTVITRGSGAKASAGSTVDVAYSVYNGSTGKELESSGYEGQGTIAIPMKPDAVLPGMLCAVEGLPVGSQTVLTGSATEVLGAGVDPSKVGLTAKDSVVFVMNVADILPEKATGTAQKPVAGMPKVTLAKSGKPTVTIPKSDPPAETTVAVLKKGTGEAVQDGDSVTVQYQGVNWRTGKVFDQSWGRAVATFSTSQVVKGFQKALVGQSVGSQVLVTIPPADGYGTKGQPSADIKGTDTLVFVIDILKTER